MNNTEIKEAVSTIETAIEAIRSQPKMSMFDRSKNPAIKAAIKAEQEKAKAPMIALLSEMPADKILTDTMLGVRTVSEVIADYRDGFGNAHIDVAHIKDHFGL